MDMKPDQVEGHTPCIVAHMIFMCLRYPDHCHKKEMTTGFIQEVIKGIKQVTEVSVNDDVYMNMYSVRCVYKLSMKKVVRYRI